MDEQKAKRIQKDDKSTISSSEYLMAQYSALREEILKAGDTQFQILGLTLLLSGTFLSLGLQVSAFTASTLMVYPILSAFLAALWSHYYNGVVRIGIFIRGNYEEMMDKPIKARWESFVHEMYTERKFHAGDLHLEIFGARGIFIISQSLVLVLAISRSSFSLREIALLSIDSIALLSTFWFLRSRRGQIVRSFNKYVDHNSGHFVDE